MGKSKKQTVQKSRTAWLFLPGQYLSAKDFQTRLLISSVLTLPVLILSPAVSELIDLRISFDGSQRVLFFFSTALYALCVPGFLNGALGELRAKKPGTTTLSFLAVSTLFVFSAVISFINPVRTLFWEMALLINIMFVGDRITDPLSLTSGRKDFASPLYRFANRAALWFTLITIISAALTFCVWYLLLRKNLVFALQRAVTVLVIASPQALSLSVPLVMAICTAKLASHGIMVKRRKALERAGKLGAVVFSKTGVLTEGRYGVVDIEVFNPRISRDDLIKYAASVESHSTHPVARGVVDFARDLFPVTDYRTITGKGAMAHVENRRVKVVTSAYLSEHKIRFDSNRLSKMREGGKTVLYVLFENDIYGAIILSDIIRAQSRQAVGELKSMGIKTVAITNDNRAVAESVAGELHLDSFFASVPPGEKGAKVKEVQYGGVLTAVVGHAPDDCGALAQADLSCASGTGNPEISGDVDVVFTNSNPVDIITLIKYSISSRKKINGNLSGALTYNAIAILLASGALPWGVYLNPVAAALLMVLSTLWIVINSRRLYIE